MVFQIYNEYQRYILSDIHCNYNSLFYMENDMTKIKPYYYLRDGILHMRYNVDEAVELSGEETERLKKELNESCVADKQNVLAKNWDLQTNLIGKKTFDGIEYANKKMQKTRLIKKEIAEVCGK